MGCESEIEMISLIVGRLETENQQPSSSQKEEEEEENEVKDENHQPSHNLPSSSSSNDKLISLLVGSIEDCHDKVRDDGER